MKKSSVVFRAAAVGAALCLTLALAGCGADSYASSTAYMTAGAADYGTSAEMAPEEAGQGVQLDTDSTLDPRQAQEGRKIIYTASLSMESTDFEGTRAALLTAVEDCDGYLESTSQGGSAEYGTRYVSYTARIPAERYREFLGLADEAGNVLYLNENAQDITSSYVDVEARLAALKEQRDRLNALADKAETTADLLEIESQLSEVQYQIESYTSQMRLMDNQVGYSTVDIQLEEVRTLTPTTVTFGERFADAVNRGWRNTIEFVQDAILALVSLWPLLVILVLFVVAMILTRPLRRARRARAPKPEGTLKKDLEDPGKTGKQ